MKCFIKNKVSISYLISPIYSDRGELLRPSSSQAGGSFILFYFVF